MNQRGEMSLPVAFVEMTGGVDDVHDQRAPHACPVTVGVTASTLGQGFDEQIMDIVDATYSAFSTASDDLIISHVAELIGRAIGPTRWTTRRNTPDSMLR